MTDIEIIREAIELHTVHYFDTIEMSGTVQAQRKNNINYISIDLNNVQWDEDKDVDKLHQSITKYLKGWAQKNLSNFNDYIAISSLIIEYLLPEKDGTIQNQSKHLKLFYLPSYYQNQQNNNKTYSWLLRKFLSVWYNILLRNTIIMIVPTVLLIVVSIYKIQTDSGFQERLAKSYDYINIASGIIASLVLGFLIDKVITIRQDKLKYTRAIRGLSNKLTYFRKICFNLAGDHNFWTKDKPFYKSYEYANSIKDNITFEEYFYPNYDDDIEYAKYNSFYRNDVSHSVVSLVLQLHMMADNNFLHSGLTYTEFPPNYIYSHGEMEDFILFSDANQIWYCCSEVKIFPQHFQNSYHIQEVIKEYNRIYPKDKIENLSRDNLEAISLDFQYRIIPRLYNLTKAVEADLPLTIRYFTTTFSLLLGFGLIIPTLIYIFIDGTYAFMSIFVAMGIIGHILLTLKSVLVAENSLDRQSDYL